MRMALLLYFTRVGRVRMVSLHLGLSSSTFILHLGGKGENGFFAPWVVELYSYTSPGWEG